MSATDAAPTAADRNGPRRRAAVDRPAFWLCAGAVFLANAALSAADRDWPLALLQTLTALWAAVAGATVADGSSRP